MLNQIDTFILECVFTPIAWWFEYKTGRTNYFLAWLAAGLCMLTMLFLADIDFVMLQRQNTILLLCYGAFLVASAIQMLVNGARDEQARSNPGETHMRMDDLMGLGAPIRMFWIVLLVVHTTASIISVRRSGFDPNSWHYILMTVFNILYIAQSYFSMVRRPPPRPQRDKISVGEVRLVALKP